MKRYFSENTNFKITAMTSDKIKPDFAPSISDKADME